jgi:hypothetical protein
MSRTIYTRAWYLMIQVKQLNDGDVIRSKSIASLGIVKGKDQKDA